MKLSSKELLLRIYRIVLSLALIAAGVCLIIACYRIYSSGGAQIYTPEKVAQAFSPIALPVYLSLVLTAGGLLLQLIFPGTPQQQKVARNRELLLLRLQQSKELSSGDEALRSAIRRQQRMRKITVAAGILLLAAGSILAGLYGLKTTQFDHVKTFAAAMRPVLLTVVFLAVPLAYSIVTAYLYRGSMDKEIALWRQLPEQKAAAIEAAKPAAWLFVLRYGLILAAIALIAVGFTTGGWQDVLTKAVNICTECVGLG